MVTSSRANLFMTELLEGIAEAVRKIGVDAEVVVDCFPEPDRGTAFAVIPHEFFETTPESAWPDDDQLRRTIAICTEQPGTPWFEIAYDHARRCGAAVDINRVGLAELRRRGLDAHHFQLGYLPSWDRWHGDDDAERAVDVLFLGSANRRRDELLAQYSRTLWRHRCRLIVATHEPKIRPGPDFIVGEPKRELLTRAKILLSPRRQAAPYFEWVRALEAMSNGAVLVCDHAAGAAPLVAGEHFASGDGQSLALLADALLREPERLAEIRRRAYETIRLALPASSGAERLVDVATALLTAPVRELPERPDASPAVPERHPAHALLRAELKHVALDLIALRRDVAGLGRSAFGRDPVVEFSTTGANGGTPRLTVCVPAFNSAKVIADTLASVAVQDEPNVELLVLDDGSDDATAVVVRRFLEMRPWLAASLLRHPLNQGLPRTRNALAAAARAPYVLMLDADNELYPPAARRLADALDADPGALFAYPILEDHENGRGVGLRSFRAWDPALFATHNPIDALALLRRDRLLALGGYADDLGLYGWEDFELWVRAAERGEHAVHVHEILARYRRGGASMLAVTDIDTSEMWQLLRERYPRTMAGVS